MYNISEATILLATIIIFCNAFITVSDMKHKLPYLKYLIKNRINMMREFFYKSEIPPQSKELINNEANDKVANDKVSEPKYEDKYLEKYKKFPNEFTFTEEDFRIEKEELFKLTKEQDDLKNVILEKETEVELKNNLLGIVTRVVETGNLDNSEEIEMIMNHFEIEETYSDNALCNIVFKDFQRLLEYEINDLTSEIEHIKQSKLINEDLLVSTAKENMLNMKLDKLVNSYVLESTPLGNVYMRYNNFKKSFEYFSNSSMPYRYLEPIGRKYVTTFWCKPIFVDIDEELKRLEEDDKNGVIKKQVVPIKPTIARPMKNRNTPDGKLNIDNSNKKMLVKDNANRYTWEGRLSGFCPLKKIPKAVTDKKLGMSYSDFKKMNRIK